MKVKSKKKRRKDNPLRDRKPVGQPQQNFTTHTRLEFLRWLRVTGNVTWSARKVGCTRQAAYQLRQRDSGFAEQWKESMSEANDGLEFEAYRRAVVGTDKPIMYMGEKVGTIKEYSDKLLEILLKANMPNRFNDRLVHGVDSSIKELQQDRLVIEAALSDPELVEHLRNANNRVKQIECTVLEPVTSDERKHSDDDQKENSNND